MELRKFFEEISRDKNDNKGASVSLESADNKKTNNQELEGPKNN